MLPFPRSAPTDSPSGPFPLPGPFSIGYWLCSEFSASSLLTASPLKTMQYNACLFLRAESGLHSLQMTLWTCYIYLVLSGLRSVKKVIHSDFSNVVDSAFIDPWSAINTEKHWIKCESIYKNVPIYNTVKKKAWQLPGRRKIERKLI